MSPILHSQTWTQSEKKKTSAINCAGPGGCHCRLHFPAAFSEENALSKRRHWSNVRRTKMGIRKPRRRKRSADRKAKRFTLLFTYILTQITPPRLNIQLSIRPSAYGRRQHGASPHPTISGGNYGVDHEPLPHRSHLDSLIATARTLSPTGVFFTRRDLSGSAPLLPSLSSSSRRRRDHRLGRALLH